MNAKILTHGVVFLGGDEQELCVLSRGRVQRQQAQREGRVQPDYWRVLYFNFLKRQYIVGQFNLLYANNCHLEVKPNATSREKKWTILKIRDIVLKKKNAFLSTIAYVLCNL